MRLLAACAIVGLLVASYGAPSAAASKPKLPAACVDALRKGDALTAAQSATTAAAGQVVSASDIFVRGNPTATPQILTTSLQSFTTAVNTLTAAAKSGDTAVADYRSAVAACRAKTR